MRGATRPLRPAQAACSISIHAPRAGRDQAWFSQTTANNLFQSTRPVRGATDYYNLIFNGGNISIHAPRAGRDRHFLAVDRVGVRISIHAPRAGRDYGGERGTVLEGYFNPRAPCGARLPGGSSWTDCYYFNPRAPCGARLQDRGKRRGGVEDFNPRAPCGARLSLTLLRSVALYFNPRAPCGARLHKCPLYSRSIYISIHAPRAGRDNKITLNSIHQIRFQSTRPVRGATAKVYRITLHTFATKGNF